MTSSSPSPSHQLTTLLRPTVEKVSIPVLFFYSALSRPPGFVRSWFHLLCSAGPSSHGLIAGNSPDRQLAAPPKFTLNSLELVAPLQLLLQAWALRNSQARQTSFHFPRINISFLHPSISIFSSSLHLHHQPPFQQLSTTTSQPHHIFALQFVFLF